MANSDYTVRGQGFITPRGLLQAAINEGSNTMTITGFQEVQGAADDIEVGMGVMIGNEIIKLESSELPTLNITRGCADTIPAAHAAGSEVWFFTNTASGDDREYTATTEIAVKVLPVSAMSGPVPIAHAPPHDLTFNWRFSRPYAPGLMLCNGLPWYADTFELETADTQYLFTWKHRDRLLQGDQLVGHGEDTIGPEPGTTYTARVYNDLNALVRTVSGITAEEWAYSRTLAEADVPTGVGRVEICAVRDGLESWQRYSVSIKPTSGGFGVSFGESFGG